MKKRIASIVCAAMLMLALPTLAWADPSPSGSTATASTGVSATVSGGATVSANANGSFSVSGVAGQTVTAIFNVGAENAGRTVTFTIQNADGTTSTVTGVVAADGTVSVDLNQDATVSVALSGEATGAAAGTTSAKADNSSKSPATGVDMGVVAGASAVALCGAGVVTVALRKKVNE